MLDEYDYHFELGKAAELRTGRDVLMISTGLMTMRALNAASRLEADRIDVAVLHVPTIKPLDREAILRTARSNRLVVTLENHTIMGGSAKRSPGLWRLAGSPSGLCRLRCLMSFSPPAPCPPFTTATACQQTPSLLESKPSSPALPGCAMRIGSKTPHHPLPEIGRRSSARGHDKGPRP